MIESLPIGNIVRVEVAYRDVRIGTVISQPKMNESIGVADSPDGKFVIYEWDHVEVLSDEEAMLWKLENS